MYYYELHEGDNELFSDLLLARDEEMSPEDFFEVVQSIRRRIQDTFEEDTLIEAIAAELERDHGFLALWDSRLSASVHVSTDDEENYLTDLEEETAGADYRGILLDLDTGGPLN